MRMLWTRWIAIGFAVAQRAHFIASKAIITSLLAVILPLVSGVKPAFASEELGAEILASFTVPGSSPTGLAWDGTSLWMVDNLNNLYQFDTSGTVIKSCALGFSVSDFTWDGLNLWAFKDSSGSLVALDRGANCGQVLGTVVGASMSYGSGNGLAWDGSYFWMSTPYNAVIRKLDSTGKEILNFEEVFFGSPSGIAYDGTDLLIGDSFELYNRIYKYSKTGIEKAFIDIDKLGLKKIKTFERKVFDWDGTYLWYSTASRFEIYKIRLLPPSFTLTITRSGPGTVTSSPAGIDCGVACSAPYTSATPVTLTATPSPGYVFSGWSGGGCSGTGTCTVTMSQAQSVSATFGLTPTTVVGGAGPSLAPNEIGAEIFASFAAPGSSPTGLAWDGTSLWMVDNLNNLYQFNASGTVIKSCSVAFSVSDLTWDGLNLLAFKDSSGSIVALDRGANCGQVLGTVVAAVYSYGSGSGLTWDGAYFWMSIPFSAVIHKLDSTGKEILNFEEVFFGSPSGIAYDGTDLLIGDSFELYNRIYKYSKTGIEKTFVDIDKLGLKKIKTFERKVFDWDGTYLWYSTASRFEIYKIRLLPPSFALTVARSGLGTVTSNPAGIDCGAACSAPYASATQVTLTATPSPGYAFSGWSGGGCSGTGTCTVSMSQAQSVSAAFGLAAATPVLSALSISGGTTQLAGGSSFTLAATASYSNGSSKAVTPTWSSNSTAVSVSASGQVTASQVTTNTPAVVTASYTEGGVTRTASWGFTVTASTAARLVSISVQGSTSVPEGGTTTLKVIASYSDGSTKSVSANWSSSNSSLVSVAATGALTVGQVSADTTVTLTASYAENGVTVANPFVLTVKDVPNALSYLIVTGASSLGEGQTTTLSAKAYYTDDSSLTVTPTWSSSNSAVAAVSAAGLVTAGQVAADSSVTITATYSAAGVSKTALFPIVVKDSASPVINATPALASGYSHTIALRNDGGVWSWGWSSLGQSGAGETKTRSTPVKVSGIDSITSISAGAAHNLALKVDGTVWSWGHNGQGGLGDGSTDDRQTPIQVTGVTGVKALAAGLYHSLALKSDGTVLAWGSNSNGQLADASGAPVRRTPSAVAGLSGVTAIAASYNASLALKSDGTIYAWGDLGASGNLYAPVPLGQISGVQSLAAGWFHSLALKTDGTVWAWGSNAQGQLGDGSTSNRTTPVQVKGLTNVKAVAAGLNHSVAITTDGKVWTWGGNAHGQLGNKTINAQPTPQAVTDLTDAIAVAAGNEYTIALKSDGSVWGAGDNWLGQLGDGSFIGNNRFAPVQDADQARLFDLAPNQVKASVPSDQLPVFYMKSEKAGDEVLSALGSVSSMSLASKIPIAGNGFSATYQMFVAVSVPGGKPALTPGGTPGDAVRSDTVFFKIEQTGWQPYGGGVVPAYLNDVSVSGVGEIALKILESTDLTGMSGAQFLVGFGTSAEEMLGAGRYRVMYRVP